MAVRIDVRKVVADSRAQMRLAQWKTLSLSKSPSAAWVVDSYVIDAKLPAGGSDDIASALMNPSVEKAEVNSRWNPDSFAFAIEIGFLPGVTDNVGHTAKETIEDLLKIKFKEGEAVYTTAVYFVAGDIALADAVKIADALFNPLIQRAKIKSKDAYKKDGGFGALAPKVKLPPAEKSLEVNLEVSDDELVAIGKQGIKGRDGKRRGPLALDLVYMKAIRDYFSKQKRNPTDVELEMLAQTWSEHCKHTIFASPLDEVKEGIFKKYIKGATEKIRKEKIRNKKEDICVSVFKDNSGAIAFDKDYLITHKVETHNSPSALDPFGGAITGIVGVNRDALGFGMGARPIANTYGFCLADPNDARTFYRDRERKQSMLSARRIMDGVIEGIRAGGNQSGIPTPHGFLSFDSRYRGKPLVFSGTVGLIPRKVKGRKLYEKKAKPGDYIVMLGGRVGQDGIHGATFSSEAIDAGSPATAVQIGDPITQKKFSDAIVREARDAGLYSSMTDCGAGGLSSSVGEMAKESDGCEVELDEVPLKYPGLQAWQIWISESQERMTLAVPPKKWKEFSKLMEKRAVEASIIGKFTKSGKCVVKYAGKIVVDIKLDFLHDGTPVRPLKSQKPNYQKGEEIPESNDLARDMLELLSHPSIASREFIAQQYDHEVQASSIIKPLQGRGRVDGDAAVIRPVLNSDKGVVIADALYPTYSDVDTYAMAAASIDSAVRAAIAAGGSLDHLALLDNFCWCDSFNPERLFELKKAAQACYETAVAYGTPFISGKDSMFNDFKGYDDNGPINVSIPPTLLGTAIGVMQDASKAISIDLKQSGDLIYILGETNNELGASEYAEMCSERENKKYGGDVPRVSLERNKKMYTAFSKAADKRFIASAISLGRGGFAAALAKTAMAGMLGLRLNLNLIPGDAKNPTEKLFSESQGRILVSVAHSKQKAFETALKGIAMVRLGEVTSDQKITLSLASNKSVSLDLRKALETYRSPFKDF
ncbi:phosphoribosylformylglycinamidine synthase [Candidatus Kaiserbacteria bacterium]|nr:phosphoribosylformylglycinamidine synthase [Candidatus Kaiserbacteria bacterium]